MNGNGGRLKGKRLKGKRLKGKRLEGKRLEGKVALITGGSRGIGRAIALRLAEEGADVAINYQNTREHAQEVSKLIESMGRHSCIVQANVGDMEQVNRMRDLIIDRFGRIDILVNNAGIVRDKSFVKMTPQIWKEVLSVNLDGTFYCTKAFIEGMLERKYGRIVNISSVIGRMGNRGQANYAASKAGMIAITQTLAKEFAGKGVTINAVAPGFIETDMLKSVPEEAMEKILAQIPLGRLGKPSEVAGAVAYLASEEGDYITGQVIDLNGGLYI